MNFYLKEDRGELYKKVLCKQEEPFKVGRWMVYMITNIYITMLTTMFLYEPMIQIEINALNLINQPF